MEEGRRGSKIKERNFQICNFFFSSHYEISLPYRIIHRVVFSFPKQTTFRFYVKIMV